MMKVSINNRHLNKRFTQLAGNPSLRPKPPAMACQTTSSRVCIIGDRLGYSDAPHQQTRWRFQVAHPNEYRVQG